MVLEKGGKSVLIIPTVAHFVICQACVGHAHIHIPHQGNSDEFTSRALGERLILSAYKQKIITEEEFLINLQLVGDSPLPAKDRFGLTLPPLSVVERLHLEFLKYNFKAN
jgi:hypothetical protein